MECVIIEERGGSKWGSSWGIKKSLSTETQGLTIGKSGAGGSCTHSFTKCHTGANAH